MGIKIIGGGDYATPADAVADADANGRRRVKVTAAISFGEARGLCMALPEPSRPRDDYSPIGWGLFPPELSPIVVVFKEDQRDQRNEPIPTDHEALIVCMWRVGDRIVARFQSNPTTPGAVRIFDGYLSQVVRQVRHIAGHPTIKHGWEINRLDPPGLT